MSKPPALHYKTNYYRKNKDTLNAATNTLK
jgi:hypothetical protein